MEQRRITKPVLRESATNLHFCTFCRAKQKIVSAGFVKCLTVDVMTSKDNVYLWVLMKIFFSFPCNIVNSNKWALEVCTTSVSCGMMWPSNVARQLWNDVAVKCCRRVEMETWNIMMPIMCFYL